MCITHSLGLLLQTSPNVVLQAEYTLLEANLSSKFHPKWIQFVHSRNKTKIQTKCGKWVQSSNSLQSHTPIQNNTLL